LNKLRLELIARIAGVNRSTFYEYFQDIYDLKDQMEQDLLSDFVESMEVNFMRIVCLMILMSMQETALKSLHVMMERFFRLLGKENGDQ